MNVLFRRILIVSLGMMATVVSAAQTDKRLVTAGGTVTEIVFALGAGERVVAVDQSSTYPQQVTELPSVGYYRELAAEGVLSVAPDALLTIEGAGREDVLKQIAATGVKVIKYPKPSDVEGLKSLISALGSTLGKEKQAQQLINDIVSALPTIPPAQNKRAAFLLSAGSRGLMVAGSDTVPALIFERAGILNLGAEHNGYKSVGIEHMMVAEPDFLVAPYHVVMGVGGKEAFCNQPSLALVKAAQQCNLLVMDSLLAMGMTTRLAEAIGTVQAFAGAQ